MPRITVTGATSLIGYFLLPKLAESCNEIRAISRQRHAAQSSFPGIVWEQADISETAPSLQDDETLISLTPIWVLADYLTAVKSAPEKIVAFSSTSAITKRHSAVTKERQLAEQLLDGEQRLKNYCEQHNSTWTILRPTLVYGAGRDKNVSTIAKAVSRFGFFPMLGQATGLRSPVHAEDLAMAVIQCIKHPSTRNKSYELTGADNISYGEMIRRVFLALEAPPRMIKTPTKLAQLVIQLSSRLPAFSELTPEVIHRTAQDLVFDHNNAVEDFDYKPREFHPKRDDLIRASK